MTQELKASYLFIDRDSGLVFRYQDDGLGIVEVCCPHGVRFLQWVSVGTGLYPRLGAFEGASATTKIQKWHRVGVKRTLYIIFY